jgi:CRISPR/Cas system-associated exonuclease Cas4 (RecB family)
MNPALKLAIEEAPGDVMSPSSCNQYLSCSARYYYRKVRRLPDPKTGSLLIGSCVHEALGQSFAEKVETKRDLPLAGVMALYRNAWSAMAPDTEFREDEDPNEMKAEGEALATKYLEEAAPKIEPAAVEIPLSGRIGGTQVRAIIDLLDVDGRVIDIKTAARKPSEVSADYRFQVATYCQLTPGATGEARVDTLVKTKTPQLVQISIAIDAADLAQTERIYPRVQQSIRAGIFLPNRQSYLCSRRYCSFWRACQSDFGGRIPE